MPKLLPPVAFAATGSLQLYLVPESGRYVIEAAGAQGGGNRTASGGKGARLRGVFQLRAGDVLNLVIGRQGQPGLDLPLLDNDATESVFHETSNLIPALARGGGGGGGTFVWKSTMSGGRPDWPLLVAGGGGGGGAERGGDAVVTPDAARGKGPDGRHGHGGSSDMGAFYYGGGGGAGWLTPGVQGAGPTFCSGGTHWEGGAGASFGGYTGGHGGYGGGGGGCFFRSGAGGGGGYSGGGGGGGRTGASGGGGGSYNSGAAQGNDAGVQCGDGWVKVTFLSLTVTLRVPDLSTHEAKPAEPPPIPRQSEPAHELRLPWNWPERAEPEYRLPLNSRWQYLPG